jgi:hypothetical protein
LYFAHEEAQKLFILKNLTYEPGHCPVFRTFLKNQKRSSESIAGIELMFWNWGTRQ